VRQAALTGFVLAQGTHQKAYQSELIINPKELLVVKQSERKKSRIEESFKD
jgi:hypothetical protein